MYIFSLLCVWTVAVMEISGSPFAQGNQIHERANGFMSEFARLANCLDHGSKWLTINVT